MSWYYITGGKKFGPVTEAEVQLQMTSGSIEPTAMVKVPGAKEWMFARDVSGFFSYDAGMGSIPLQANSMSPHVVSKLVQTSAESPIIAIRNWYSSLTNKRRLIVLGIAVALSAVPFVGWIFIFPWLIPFMIYLEYQRP